MLIAECSSRLPASAHYSVITVDCPVRSKRLRQRRFLQAIWSSLRTMYERNLAKRARSRSSARPPSCRFLVRTTHATSYSPGWWQWGQFKVAGFFCVLSSKKSRSSIVSCRSLAGLGHNRLRNHRPGQQRSTIIAVLWRTKLWQDGYNKMATAT
jgi:hypothetical protein